jgi:RNA polymerase sigma factor (sigma-70 family)
MNCSTTETIADSGRLPLINELDCTWRAVHAKLQRRARLLCKGDVHRADDILSDTALKVFLYLQRTPERVQNLAGFLFLALNHAFLDQTRRRGREDRYLDRDCSAEDDHLPGSISTAPSPEQQLAFQQEIIRLEKIHAELSPEQHLLFQLKFEQDQPYPVIAAALGISEVLARKRVELLRKKLRKLLEPENAASPSHTRRAKNLRKASTADAFTNTRS